MKIASVVGTRPQFIKLSPVSKQIRKVADEIIIHTGQHYAYEMDRLFFNELEIPLPNYNLRVGSGSHGYQTGEMLIEIEKVLIHEDPDLVLVYGDCNSTLAGALAAVKLGISVGHIEAGCRTYDRTPEEINRRCVDHVSDFLFAISEGTSKTLESEKVFGEIFNVGSTVVDACLSFSEKAENNMVLDEKYFVLTLHRPENVDDAQRLHTIIGALHQTKEQIVFPIHPRTIKNLTQYGLFDYLSLKENILKIPPMGYLDFLALLEGAHTIISDSGSIQQEVATLRKRCVRLFSGELYPELSSYPGGMYASPSRIVEAIDLLHGVCENKLEAWKNPLGNGKASEQISKIIIEEMEEGRQR